MNTFGMKVKARCFMEYDSVADLVDIEFEELARPVLHIGGGSNLLFTDDFKGTVLHSKINFIEILGEYQSAPVAPSQLSPGPSPYPGVGKCHFHINVCQFVLVHILISEHRLTCGSGFIKTAYRSCVRSCLERIRICNRLGSNVFHDFDETIQCFFRLCLGRLDHDRLMEEKREIDRWSMESIVQKPLCDIEGGNAGRLVKKTVENELMLAYSRNRKLEAVLERLLDIIRTQNSKRTDHPDILFAKHQDICISP